MSDVYDILNGVTVVQLLDRPTYLYAEVDRLIRLKGGTARRWINGYERSGKQYPPVLRAEAQDTEWVTWGEFVEARMLSEFREARVPLSRLRAAVEQLRRQFETPYPLAHLRPYLEADHGELTVEASGLDPSDKGLLVVRTGQRILEDSRPVMLSATLSADAHGNKFAAEIEPDPEFPGIKMHPDRLSGQPTFEGRRIAIVTVAAMVESGEAPPDIAADFGLSLAQVDAAVRFAQKHELTA